MGKNINLRIGFESLKKSILDLSISEKKELLELIEHDLSAQELELKEPSEEYLLSESALKKDWEKKEEDEAWKDL
jgi:hypothetical protein